MTGFGSFLTSIYSGNTTALVMVLIGVITIVVHFVSILYKKSSNSHEAVALNPEEFQPFTLVQKESLSHDTRRFTYALQTPKTKLGLPIGQHISFRFTDKEGKTHQRSYTPVTGDEVVGTVTFVIKVYKAGVHPKFPEGGKMSQYLDSLQIGDVMDMKGPKGNLHYLGKGHFTVKELGKPLQKRLGTHFGMIAGGTGITPCVQVIEAMLRDEKDTSIIHLLYANQSEEDILLRQEIDVLQEKYKHRLSVHYTIDRPSPGWKGSTGFVSKDMIAQYVLPKDRSAWRLSSTQVLMCGPPPMLKFACLPALKELDLDDNQMFSF